MDSIDKIITSLIVGTFLLLTTACGSGFQPIGVGHFSSQTPDSGLISIDPIELPETPEEEDVLLKSVVLKVSHSQNNKKSNGSYSPIGFLNLQVELQHGQKLALANFIPPSYSHYTHTKIDDALTTNLCLSAYFDSDNEPSTIDLNSPSNVHQHGVCTSTANPYQPNIKPKYAYICTVCPPVKEKVLKQGGLQSKAQSIEFGHYTIKVIQRNGVEKFLKFESLKPSINTGEEIQRVPASAITEKNDINKKWLALAALALAISLFSIFVIKKSKQKN